MSNKTKRKYNTGVSRIAVPNGAQQGAMSTAGSGAIAGASAGASFGPWGAVIGGVVGGGLGYVNQVNTNANNKILNQGNKLIDGMNKYNKLPSQFINDDVYEDGTSNVSTKKQVEIEGGEDIYKKIDSRFILKHTAKGPSHANGGVGYIAEAGDIIVPKQKSQEWFKHYSLGRHEKLEALRSKLPADKGNVYARGVKKIVPSTDPIDGYNPEVFDGQSLTNYNWNNNSNNYKLPANNSQFYNVGNSNNMTINNEVNPTLNTIPANTNYFTNENLGLNNPTPTTNNLAGTGTLGIPEGVGRSYNIQQRQPSTFGKNVGTGVMTAAELAPTIYNTIQGFGNKAQKMDYYQMNPQLQNEYVDVVRQLNDVDRGVSLATDSINNFAGGNANTYLSNMSALRLASLGQKNQINQYKADSERQIRSQNVDTLNQSQQYNLQNRFAIDDINNQNAARQRDFQAAAVTGASDYLQSRNNTALENQKIRNYNQFVLPYLKTDNYKSGVRLNRSGSIDYNNSNGTQFIKPLDAEVNNFYDRDLILSGSAPQQPRVNRYKLRNQTRIN